MQTRVGLIGSCPTHVAGPIRGDRFDRLQQHLGRLEGASATDHPALHAACHLLMNGVDRVVFVGVPPAATPEDWHSAMDRLNNADNYAAVLIPGDPYDLSEHAVAHWLRVAPETPLWLDAPSGPLPEQLAFRATLPSDRVRMVTPRIPTQSPGRRCSESLPGSIFGLVLALGTTPILRGVHGAPGSRPLGEMEQLRAAGVDQLMVAAPSGRITLRAGHTTSGPHLASPSAPMSLATHIQELLRGLAEPLLLTERYDEHLRKRLERAATVALEPMVRKGTLTSYRVQCLFAEAEQEPGFIFEVALREPKRVKALVLRFNPLA